jgi:hypothetical protein
MRRGSLGAVVGLGGATIALAFATEHCAEPTQIVVDIRTDQALCGEIRNTGVVVTSPEKRDTEPLDVFEDRPGCETPPGDRIGTLVIAPSGAKDEEIGIRIVAGLDRPAEQCKAPWEGCIVQRRTLRFTPGVSKAITIILWRECVGKSCGPDAECTETGACVDPGDILPDGGTVKDAATSAPEASSPWEGGTYEDAAPDAPPIDAGVDAPLDPCTNCRYGAQCDPATRKCVVECGQGKTECEDPTKPPCGYGLDCQYKCSDQTSCNQGVRCETDGGCVFDCTAGGACSNVVCRGSTCEVNCKAYNACGAMDLNAGDSGVNCENNGSCSGDVVCAGGKCHLECRSNGGPNSSCPPKATCTAPTVCEPPERWQQ